MRLALVFIHKAHASYGQPCAACGEAMSWEAVRGRWEVVRLDAAPTEAGPAWVCTDCLHYHAPELVPAVAAANALHRHLRERREAKEQATEQSTETELPF